MRGIFFRIYGVIYTLCLKYFYKNIKTKGKIVSSGFFSVEISKSATLDIVGTIVLRSNVLIAARNGAKLIIKDGCFFNRDVSIVCRESIEIGKNSIFGEGVKIYDNNHKVINGKISNNKFDTEKIIIGSYCWIGNGVNILKGSIIQNKTIIGAMSLVKGRLSRAGIYVGVPVKFLSPLKTIQYD